MASPSSSGAVMLSNASATGSAIDLFPNDYCWAVDGTFSGATVSLGMLSPDGSSYLTVDGTALTAEGAVIVTMPLGTYKAQVSGGPPSGIYATLKPAVRNR